MATGGHSFEPVALGDRELARIATLVRTKAGITLTPAKRPLIIARLQKRLRHLKLKSYADYLTLLETDTSGAELTTFLDALTTNHTYFFREEQHFDLLAKVVAPEWRKTHPSGPIKIWCAACSSGQEPYTIAMTLADMPTPLPFTMLASDLSTKVLEKASTGVYRMEDVRGLPVELLRRHFERGMGEQSGLARVSAALRKPITYKQINLLEQGPGGQPFDVIFCRNVMIYFESDVQQRVVAMLERHLAPGGYLFVSHSESLNSVQHGLKWIAPAAYRKPLHA
ncbi:MAG: protein-glutamate O-methyltransferase CheR [Acidobacteria bacterium]|nr:protein-glutamate O-methyltransferase CheR [Acidobacteriota bacterium]